MSLNPAHEVLNIFWCWHLRRLLELLIILPQVLEFVRCLHLWAALRTTKFCDRSIEKVDLVIEIDDYLRVSGHVDVTYMRAYH